MRLLPLPLAFCAALGLSPCLLPMQLLAETHEEHLLRARLLAAIDEIAAGPATVTLLTGPVERELVSLADTERIMSDSLRDWEALVGTSEEYAGIRAYVDSAVGTAQEDLWAARIYRFAPCAPIGCITRPDAEGVLTPLRNALQKLSALPSLTVDLRTVTTPDQALVKLRASGDHTFVRATHSNDTFERVYRGLFTATITKEDYKTARLSMNLVDDTGSLLECRLAEESGPHWSICSLR